MGNSFTDFLKKNATQNSAGVLGGLGLASDITGLATGESKLKAIGNILKNLLLGTVLWEAAMASAFRGMSKGIRSLLHDTGSLDQALRKLSQIQGWQKLFAPLAGGAEAAKTKVAELVNLAASKNLKLDSVAAGARSLQIFTNGAYSGAKALNTVIDAASGTGNEFTDMADAVGEFNANLRGGNSIVSASEKLRQMGAITSDTANRLNFLQQNGASAGEVFDTLTSSLDQFSGSAEKAKDSIEGVNQAYAAATANLQEKFASPFTAAEVQNTKNWTAALNALAPTIGSVASFLQILTGGFSTVTSSIAKAIAETPILRDLLGGVAKAVAILIAGISTLGALGLATWLANAGTACATLGAGVGNLIVRLALLLPLSGAATTSMAAFGVAVGGFVAAAASILATVAAIAVVVSVIIAMGGALYNYVNANKAAQKAADDLRTAHDRTTDAMLRQINAIKTLADQHDALAKALDDVTTAQEELNKAEQEAGENGSPKTKEARRNVEEKKKIADEALKSTPTALTTGETSLIQQKIEKEKTLTEQQYQNELENSSPQHREQLLKQHGAGLQSRAARAQVGADAAGEYSRTSVEAQTKVMAAQKTYDNAVKEQEDFSKNHPRGNAGRLLQLRYEAEDRLIDAKHEQKRLGLNAPKDSSVYAEAMARQETNPEKASRWQAYAIQRKSEEGNATALAQGAISDKSSEAVAQRENALAKTRADTEYEIAKIKDRGLDRAQKEAALRIAQINRELAFEQSRPGGPDSNRVKELLGQGAAIGIQRREDIRSSNVDKLGLGRGIAEQEATLKGDHRGLQRLRDVDTFAEDLEKARSVATAGGGKTAEQNAQDIAVRQTRNSIALDMRQQGLAVNSAIQADSLTRIGGGGNVEASSGNPMMALAKRQADLQQQMAEYLKQILGKTGGAKIK